MFIIAAILSVVLAVAFAGSGITKATGRPQMVAGLGRLGVSPGLTRTIGGLELAGVAGLLIGLARPGADAAGIAAAGRRDRGAARARGLTSGAQPVKDLLGAGADEELGDTAGGAIVIRLAELADRSTDPPGNDPRPLSLLG